MTGRLSVRGQRRLLGFGGALAVLLGAAVAGGIVAVLLTAPIGPEFVTTAVSLAVVGGALLVAAGVLGVGLLTQRRATTDVGPDMARMRWIERLTATTTIGLFGLAAVIVLAYVFVAVAGGGSGAVPLLIAALVTASVAMSLRIYRVAVRLILRGAAAG